MGAPEGKPIASMNTVFSGLWLATMFWQALAGKAEGARCADPVTINVGKDACFYKQYFEGVLGPKNQGVLAWQ